jgi:antitoxin MazE
MKALLVSIGNSRGVRIPKPLIEQCGLMDEVDLDVQDGTILIRAPRVRPRAGWTNAFARMAREGDDKLAEGHFPSTEWDKDEWAWK